MSDSEPRSGLTTRQGHPVYDNQSQRTVGERGPATLENYHFLEKISHFDRERIPERVVHARGFVAHGHFEAYGTIGDEPASTYTRANLPDWEREDLVANLVTMLGDCEPQIQERMVEHLTRCDADYGRQVADGLGLGDATAGNGASRQGRFAPGAQATTEPARP